MKEHATILQNNSPLVSIIVITYNSAKFLIETLESAKSQSYENIELIISDDGSTDNTLQICDEWLQNNATRFSKTQILQVKKNTGVSANCSRGSEAATGDWVKFIAGDDILAPDCVETLLHICLKKDYKVLVSDLKCFTKEEEYDYPYNEDARNFFFTLDVENKYKFYLLNPFFLNVPSLFINKMVLEIPDIFNLKYKFLEDQPMIYTILKNKIDIHYAKVQVVFYRMHENSIVGSMSTNFRRNLFECYKEYRKPFIQKTFKGLIQKTMLELHYYINIHYSQYNFSHRAIRKMLNILIKATKNYIKPVKL